MPPIATTGLSAPETQSLPAPGVLVEDWYKLLWRSLPCHQPTGRLVHSLAVTSWERGVGVSTVARGLALAAASGGHNQVLLVDLNFLNPTLGGSNAAVDGLGVCDLLRQPYPLNECCLASVLPNLWLLSSGRASGKPSDVYDSSELPRLIERLGQQFDFTVFDLPACFESSGPACLARHFEGMLLVVEAERSEWRDGLEARRRLERAGAKIVGAVMNKCRSLD